jgi:hypothetical protein
MVSQCANPDCRRELYFLRDGKIYLFDVPVKSGGRRTEYYWLCGECSRNMVVTCVNQSEIKTVLRPGLATARRS